MSERRKPHNGRDKSGQFKVKQADVEDVRTDPDGVDVIRDDVRLGGAVEDVGPSAGQRGEEIGELIDQNRENVAKVAGRRRGRKRPR